MTSTRREKLRFRTSLVANLLAGAALCSGCGADGAGTIHIESSKAKKQFMQIGAGVAPIASAKPGPAETPRKSIPRSAIQKQLSK
jgi:hypothetical protein